MRRAGHVRPKETIGDWERIWVLAYSGEGFSYRIIAAMVFGISAEAVTSGEMSRVGRVARKAGAGCNLYRNGANHSARQRLGSLSQSGRSQKPRVLKVSMFKLPKRKKK